MKAKGKYDYDEEYDILYVGAPEKGYAYSIEIDNGVVDIDKEGKICGIQIFDASECLGVEKECLRKKHKWSFSAEVYENRLILRVIVQIRQKNKIIEKNLIIHHILKKHYPDSEIVCTS